MPTGEFKEQEEKRQAAEVASANAEIADKTVIFWSRAEKLVIGNWRKEEISAGRIIKPEQGLKFYENMRTTEDLEMIKFIRESNAFACGDVVECKTRQEAADLTKARKALKGITDVKAEDVSQTVIEEV